jgi:hypothetical protein
MAANVVLKKFRTETRFGRFNATDTSIFQLNYSANDFSEKKSHSLTTLAPALRCPVHLYHKQKQK